ncbi:unnamed protein product [Phyllotreta striolata]|uniref:Uncharacterized protein n=1 Tax=Phyllotreta striolata TaxID=444603 RepID=A0A9N9TWA9_PHYSR|nr:unnamed protein product [Phyllotreta striolata]
MEAIRDVKLNPSKISGLLELFTRENLQALEEAFKESTETGLNKEEFCDKFQRICNTSNEQSLLLYNNAVQNSTNLTWSKFLDYLIENASPKTYSPLQLTTGAIEAASHATRETIRKIVVIETDKYFCYVAVSLHGRVGVYDGNANFLTSYHAVFTEHDLKRSDDERRRRNRWITDAVFCPDSQMLALASSTRSLAIYEASGLKHEPCWCGSKLKKRMPVSVLIGGTSSGDLLLHKFLQVAPLRRKHADRLSIYYWHELKKETSYMRIKWIKNVHSCEVERMDYNSKEDAIISCSKDPEASLVKTFLIAGKCPYVLKIRKGCTCFTFSNILSIIVTGSADNTIRIWNSVLDSNVIAVLKGHESKIQDVAVMDTQRILLSFSADGVVKVWNIDDNKCLQSEKIPFPAYTTLGKSVEYGKIALHPGPKRQPTRPSVKNDRKISEKYFGISEVEERPTSELNQSTAISCVWERSNIIVTCCNYIAKIRTVFDNVDMEISNDMPVFPPPPLQNSVLIPSSWQVPMENTMENQNQEELELATNEACKNLDFIFNKDLLELGGSKLDINYRIAQLEAKKIQASIANKTAENNCRRDLRAHPSTAISV